MLQLKVTFRNLSSQLHQLKLSELRESQTSMLQYLKKSRDQIQKLSAEVQLKVSSDFTDEIRRLETIVDNFKDAPFSDNANYLPIYREVFFHS